MTWTSGGCRWHCCKTRNEATSFPLPGGLRVLYLYLKGDGEIWFFTLYDKDEVKDLTPREKVLLRKAVDEELAQRRIRS